MLMEPIIIVFVKLMGPAISGHWVLRDTGTTRDYDTLARSLGWLSGSGSGPGWQSHKNVTFSPVGHACLPKWLRPVTAKRADNPGDIVQSIYLILLHRLFFPDSSFKQWTYLRRLVHFRFSLTWMVRLDVGWVNRRDMSDWSVGPTNQTGEEMLS